MPPLESEFNPITGQLVIKEGSTEVTTGQFERNQEIRSVIFPDTLLSIGDQGFAYTSNLENINFGESLVSLGKESFFDNAGIAVARGEFHYQMVALGVLPLLRQFGAPSEIKVPFVLRLWLRRKHGVALVEGVGRLCRCHSAVLQV